MAGAKTFRELVAWKKAVELAKATYRSTQTMPESERFGLTSQMRRSAVSIASNIAEGNARQTRREYLYFLCLARGSLAELDTQMIIARDLGFMKHGTPIEQLLMETDRVLQGLIRSLQPASPTRSSKQT